MCNVYVFFYSFGTFFFSHGTLEYNHIMGVSLCKSVDSLDKQINYDDHGDQDDH